MDTERKLVILVDMERVGRRRAVVLENIGRRLEASRVERVGDAVAAEQIRERPMALGPPAGAVDLMESAVELGDEAVPTADKPLWTNGSAPTGQERGEPAHR